MEISFNMLLHYENSKKLKTLFEMLIVCDVSLSISNRNDIGSKWHEIWYAEGSLRVQEATHKE